MSIFSAKRNKGDSTGHSSGMPPNQNRPNIDLAFSQGPSCSKVDQKKPGAKESSETNNTRSKSATSFAGSNPELNLKDAEKTVLGMLSVVCIV